MTREDNPEYYDHCCAVIFSVFRAEEEAQKKLKIKENVKEGKISADEYIQAVCDELLHDIKPDEIPE